VSRGMAWPAVGLGWGGEACAAAQPATRGRSRPAVPPELVWAAGARISEIEKAAQPLD
jgi:hypothetical protein